MSFRVSFISVFLCIALLGSMAGAELTAVRLSADSQSDEVFAHWQGDLSDGARLDISDPGKQDLTRGGEVDAFNLSLSYRPPGSWTCNYGLEWREGRLHLGMVSLCHTLGSVLRGAV